MHFSFGVLLMNMTNDEYRQYSDSHQPRSKCLGNCLKAFLVGGLICCIGEAILNVYADCGLDRTDASSAASATLVFIGALLLGCTHYGLISDAISAYLGPDTILVGAADASAETTARYLRDCDMLASGGGSESYYTSGSTADFEALAPIMLGYGLKSAVNHVEPFALD